MDNIQEAISAINSSQLNEEEKHSARNFLKQHNNEAPFIIDAKNRSGDDPNILSQFLTSMMTDMSGGHNNNNNMDTTDLNKRSNYDTSSNEYNYDNVKQWQQGSAQRQQTPKSIDRDRDYDQGRHPDTSRHGDTSAYSGGSRYEKQQQQHDDHHHYDEVNIFKNDNDVNPALTFDGGIDWPAIKQNFNLYSGWLKRKGDPTGKRVRSPFQPGDYTLVDAVPEFKRIRVVFCSVASYWDSDQKVLIKHGDTPDDIRKKVQNTLKFDRRHFSLYQLIESTTHNKVNFDYHELDENKTYELIIPWLSKFQKKKEDQVANKPNTTTTPQTGTTQAPSTTTPASSGSGDSHHKRNCIIQ